MPGVLYLVAIILLIVAAIWRERTSPLVLLAAALALTAHAWPQLTTLG